MCILFTGMYSERGGFTCQLSSISGQVFSCMQGHGHSGRSLGTHMHAQRANKLKLNAYKENYRFVNVRERVLDPTCVCCQGTMSYVIMLIVLISQLFYEVSTKSSIKIHILAKVSESHYVCSHILVSTFVLSISTLCSIFLRINS